jgi:uracil-DNA glycosylase family 4
MTPHRRARLLKALDLDAWRPRDAPSSAVVIEPELAITAPAARLAAASRPAPRPAAPPTLLPVEPPATTVDDYVAPADWDGLAAAVAGCTRCKLCKTRTNTVFGVGPRDAPLLVIGEGPGADEDAKGEPFVGPAGQLLDRMLASIGRDRGRNVFIANVVKCRPPGNRDPEADEVAACRPYLDRQIELLAPTLIVALGKVAASRLLGSDAPLGKLRGTAQVYGPASTPVLVSYHPAYLLRAPGEKAKSWADLKQVHRLLAAAGKPAA